MGKGAKIAIGCGIAAVLVVVISVGAVIGFGYWGLKRTGLDPSKMRRFGELQQKVNAISFTAPTDGVIAEDRFVRFLAIRKAVFPVYEQHRVELERLREKRRDTSAGDALSMVGVVSGIQFAKTEAMAAEGMGTAEYTWLAAAVYRTQIGARIAAATGGRSASQAVAEAMERARRSVEAERQRSGQDSAQRERALEETQRQIEAAGQVAQVQAATVDVPAANLELFAKYKADIDRYAMPELALMGL